MTERHAVGASTGAQRVTIPSSTVDPDERASLQRRTVRVLIASQILGGVGVGAGFAVISLLAYELTGTASLSGVPPTVMTVGAALAALGIARVAVRAGRRPGLAAGYLVGAGGALLAVVAAQVGSFPLHVASALAFGCASAANLQARYAATDLASDERRASALSTVVWATTVGAVLGPNLTGPGEVVATSLGLHQLAGPYVFSFASFASAGLVQLLWLRPDPLVVARRYRHAEVAAARAVAGATDAPGVDAPGVDAHGVDAHGVVDGHGVVDAHAAEAPPPVGGAVDLGDTSLRSAVRTIWRVPAARAALVVIGVAHATMVGVMVMTPVHMEHHGAALRLVGLTISLHIAGMYALSPVVGWLADHLGRRPVLLLGCAQLAAAAVLAATATPTGPVAFHLALILLGTGWSCCLVAGSTLLTDSLTPEARPAGQGASDLVMNLSGGVGGTLAGIVLAIASYEALALGSLAIVAVPVVLVLLAGERRGHPVAEVGR